MPHKGSSKEEHIRWWETKGSQKVWANMAVAVGSSSGTALWRKQPSDCNMRLALHEVDAEQNPEWEDIASHSHTYMAQWIALASDSYIRETFPKLQ
jgi:hypothetical protein